MAITLRTTKGSALTHAELDDNFTDLQGRLGVDSSDVISLIDSDYVQLRQTTVASGLDSDAVITLIDSDYVQLRQTTTVAASGLDSDAVISLIDSDYVQLRQTTVASGLDSAAVLDISLANVVEDTTPQLGGDLAVNSNTIEYTFILAGDGGNYQFTDSGSNWFTTSTNDPEIYLRRGETYRFYNTQPSSHPFEIRDSENGSAYNVGVTNNANASGAYVTFTPTMTAPSTLYYICTVHGSMGNTINIV